MLGVLRRTPVAVVVAVLVLVAFPVGVLFRADSVFAAIVGTGPAALRSGRWWSPLSAVIVTHSVAAVVVSATLAWALLGTAERLVGSWRTATTFVVTAVGGIVLAAGLQALFSSGAGTDPSLVAGLAGLDPLTGFGATLVAVSGAAGALWRRRIRFAAVGVVAIELLAAGGPGAEYGACTMLVGFALLAVPHRTRDDALTGVGRGAGAGRVVAQSSDREVRVLGAGAVLVLVACAAVVLVTPTHGGPLAPFGSLFGLERSRCIDGLELDSLESCVQHLQTLRVHRVLAVLPAVIPLGVLAGCAAGLVRGSRFALWVTVLTLGLVAAGAAVRFGFLPVWHPLGGAGPSTTTTLTPTTTLTHRPLQPASLVASVGVPLLVAVGLVVVRSRFLVAVDLARVRRAVGVSVLAFVAVVGVVVVGVAGRGGAARDALFDLWSVLARIVPGLTPHIAGPPAVVPGATPALPGVAVASMSPALAWSLSIAFWLVVAVATLVCTLPAVARTERADVRRARALVEQHGGDTFAAMTTWPGNSHWFGADGRVGVAYRVSGGVAVTVGGPFGAVDARAPAVDAFGRFCTDRGWTPVLYGIDAATADLLAASGWGTAQVGEDAVVDPSSWSMTGKRRQDVRTSVNRARRDGLSVLRGPWDRLPLRVRAQITRISEDWVASRELPEMGFTLGGLDELREPGVVVDVALDAAGQVLALVSWLPTHGDGVVVGATLDVMRRRGDAPNGVMEYLIAEAILRAAEQGWTMLSLSAVPLVRSGEGPAGPAAGSAGPAASSAGDTAGSAGDTPVDPLDRLVDALEPVYGFRSLLRFKRKFGPEFHTLHMAYPDPLALPAIARALVRIYLPGLSIRQAVSVLRGARRARAGSGVPERSSGDRVRPG